MNKSAGSLLIIIIFLINIRTAAQGQAALQFLTYPFSPLHSSMGSTGTSLPADNAFAFLYNPAQLGYSSQKTNLVFQFYPEESKIFDFISLNGLALNAGYNFNKLINFPLSVGFGYADNKMDYDFFSEDEDSYRAYSVGVGIDYYVKFSLGYTYKDITTKIASTGVKNIDGEYGFSGYDLGFLLDVPVLKLIDENLTLDLIDNEPLIPLLDFSIGYSQLNIGDDIYFVDPAQKDPLPRVARLGYAISAGLKLADQKNALEIFHFDFTVDAEDYLIKRDSLGFSYQHGLGDINIWDNIFGIKGDENVASHAGLKFSLLETADIMTGHIGTHDILQTTNGYGIRLKGLLKFISNQSDNSLLNFIAGHFDLRYYHSEYLTHTPVETDFNGLEILFSDFVFE